MDKQRYSFKMGIDMKGTQKMGNLMARGNINSKMALSMRGIFIVVRCGVNAIFLFPSVVR